MTRTPSEQALGELGARPHPLPHHLDPPPGAKTRILRSRRVHLQWGSNHAPMSEAALPARPCRNHPGRPGIGGCPTCGAVICEECSTRVEGILHCRTCLAKVADAGARGGWRSASAVIPALLLGPLAWLATSLALIGFVSLLGLVSEWARKT